MDERYRWIRWALVLALMMSAPTPSLAGAVKVRIDLPIRAAISLDGRETLGLSSFIVVRQEGEESFRGSNLDVQRELNRYLIKILRRDTTLKILELGKLDFPSFDLDVMASDADFWRAVGERTGSDLILAGSIDFDIQDKSGYRVEEYSSPYDGRTYYRQVLVEETGFDFDVLMQVYDGRTGELLHRDNFKDFQTFAGSGADPVMGMFENLYAIEDRIVGIFIQKRVETTRLLFKP